MLKPMGLSMGAGMLRDSCRASSAQSRNGRLQSVVRDCMMGAISSSSFVVTGVETSCNGIKALYYHSLLHMQSLYYFFCVSCANLYLQYYKP